MPGGRLISKQQPDFHGTVKMTRRERLNPLKEFIPYPLQYEAIGRDQREDVAIDADFKRADPGSELLGGEFLFEAGETEAPETVHWDR